MSVSLFLDNLITSFKEKPENLGKKCLPKLNIASLSAYFSKAPREVATTTVITPGPIARIDPYAAPIDDYNPWDYLPLSPTSSTLSLEETESTRSESDSLSIASEDSEENELVAKDFEKMSEAGCSHLEFLTEEFLEKEPSLPIDSWLLGD